MTDIAGPYVFLSYASADRDRAAGIADALQAAGVNVWLDRESIAGGSSWGSEIVEGIKGCAALLICCTETAMQSRNVKQEIQLAWRYERAYLPLLLEAVQFPEQVQYFLEGWQWVEVLDRPEQVWLLALVKALTRLGVEPRGQAATRADAPHPTAVPVAPPPVVSRGPFVGRSAEFAVLVAALEAAAAGQGRLVLLAGEPGIGKTRLAERLADEARERGCLVLWGRCWEDDGAPAFWPWVEALGAYARSQDPDRLRAVLGSAAPDLAQLVPEVRAQLPDVPEPPPGEPEQARFRLFAGVTDLFRRLAATQPVLLVLDDLHWADKPSLLLLQFLTRQLGGIRLIVLGSYRDTDLDRRHPLGEALTSLRREATCERVSLAGLLVDEVVALLEGRAGHVLGASGRELAQALHRETEGNPLFVSETLRHLVETGGIIQQDGRWQVTAGPIAVLGIPEGVRQVIGRRLSRLSERCNQLLAAASVAGREFDADLLERVSGEPAEAVDEALSEATAAALILELRTATGRHRFSHALVRQTLLEELPARRRVRLHRQIGEALETYYGARAEQHAAELAYHFDQAGEMSTPAALRYSKLAAEQAEAATAWEEAARHYERCLALIADAEDGLGEDEAALLLALGRCWRQGFEIYVPRQRLLRAIDLYRERGDWRGMAEALIQCMGMLEQNQSIPIADEVLASLGEGEPYLTARLLFTVAGYRYGEARAEEAATQAEALAHLYGYADVAANLLGRAAHRAWDELQLEEQRKLARAAYASLDDLGDRPQVAHYLRDVAISLLEEGRLDEGEAVAAEAQEYSRRFHVRGSESLSAGVRAAVALARGERERFLSLTGAIPSDHEMAGSYLLLTAAEQAGDRERGAALAVDIRTNADSPVARLQAGRMYGALARMRFLAADEPGARAALDAWVTGYRATPRFTSMMREASVAEIDECLPALGVGSLVAEVYEEIKGWMQIRFGATSARGFDHIRGALALRLGLVSEAEAHYRTGLAWAERERCPVEQGRCLQGMAETAVRRGEHQEAAQLLDRAAALFEQYGALLYLRQVRAAIELLPA
jgi:predicted ATPase